jgi:hypothetical protein
LLDVREEHFSIHGPLDHHRRRHFIMPQATKVIVSHAPSGTVPITLTPRGARPFQPYHIRADLLTAVSWINTSRAYPTSTRSRHISALPFGSL